VFSPDSTINFDNSDLSPKISATSVKERLKSFEKNEEEFYKIIKQMTKENSIDPLDKIEVIEEHECTIDQILPSEPEASVPIPSKTSISFENSKSGITEEISFNESSYLNLRASNLNNEPSTLTDITKSDSNLYNQNRSDSNMIDETMVLNKSRTSDATKKPQSLSSHLLSDESSVFSGLTSETTEITEEMFVSEIEVCFVYIAIN